MKYIKADWPAPNWVRAITTTRDEGHSKMPYGKGNLAHHVGDDLRSVKLNRLELEQQLNLKKPILWLNQTHSTKIQEITASTRTDEPILADGVWTRSKDVVCAVMSGDCLPVLLSDEAGTVVAAVHCGWRGLLDGILDEMIETISPHANGKLIAWFGPCIGQSAYEVGRELLMMYLDNNVVYSQAFNRNRKTHKYLADLNHLARLKLSQLGVAQVYGGEHCTFTETDKFFSYRRASRTGRMATMIWLHTS